MKRYLETSVIKDLSKKMVFLGGARQVGKTTLARHILKSFPFKKSKKGLYLNWDFDEDKLLILKKKWDLNHQLLVLDELHKYPEWKNWIKGVYDKMHTLHRFLVTGSARLDIYIKGGDSLFGRYHYWRLHPFTIDELPPKMTFKEGLKRLMTVGGFPEPFLDGSIREAKRWRRERFNRVVKEDIRDLQSINKMQNLDLFVHLLRERGGQIIVLSNMARQIHISPKTAKWWLEVLQKMYICFCVWPYTKNLSRAIQKPPKVYFFDNADLVSSSDEGPVFENLVATHLLKKIHYLEDSTGVSYELRYIRDKESREVDFVIIREGKLLALIEVKLRKETISRSLQYYAEKLKPLYAIQIVAHIKHEYKQNNCRILSLKTALNTLFGKI